MLILIYDSKVHSVVTVEVCCAVVVKWSVKEQYKETDKQKKTRGKAHNTCNRHHSGVTRVGVTRGRN